MIPLVFSIQFAKDDYDQKQEINRVGNGYITDLIINSVDIQQILRTGEKLIEMSAAFKCDTFKELAFCRVYDLTEESRTKL